MFRVGGAIAMLVLALAAMPQAAFARNTVLVLFDEDKELPGLAMINDSLQETFREALKDQVEFHTESLGLSQFDRPGYDEAVRSHLARKY